MNDQQTKKPGSVGQVFLFSYSTLGGIPVDGSGPQGLHFIAIIDLNFREKQAYQKIAHGYKERVSSNQRQYNQQYVHNITFFLIT